MYTAHVTLVEHIGAYQWSIVITDRPFEGGALTPAWSSEGWIGASTDDLSDTLLDVAYALARVAAKCRRQLGDKALATERDEG